MNLLLRVGRDVGKRQSAVLKRGDHPVFKRRGAGTVLNRNRRFAEFVGLDVQRRRIDEIRGRVVCYIQFERIVFNRRFVQNRLGQS